MMVGSSYDKESKSWRSRFTLKFCVVWFLWEHWSWLSYDVPTTVAWGSYDCHRMFSMVIIDKPTIVLRLSQDKTTTVVQYAYWLRPCLWCCCTMLDKFWTCPKLSVTELSIMTAKSVIRHLTIVRQTYDCPTNVPEFATLSCCNPVLRKCVNWFYF